MSVVVGIDLSTFSVDLARLDETTDAAEWTRLSLVGASAFDRCRSVRRVMPLASWFDGVYLAAIESPMGRGEAGTQAKLNRVFGAVVACLPERLEVWDVSPADWRRGLGLPGNADKARCAAAVDVLRGPGADGWPQDACDAYAVAYFAREVNRRALEAAA